MTGVGEGEVLGGRYRLLRRLGEGGFGAVYEAEHLRVPGRRLAVKVIDPILTRDERLRRRFLREVEAATRLVHPSILVVRDVDVTPEGVCFCAMDFSPGRSLRAVLAESGGRLAPRRAVGIVAQALEGLAHAHDRGVVHRDVKPENILVETDRATGAEVARLVDFGLAKLVDDEEGGGRFTTPGAVLGTCQYLAPEQAQGQDVDGRADVYSTGIVLYEAIAGELPFRERSHVAFALAHLTKPAPRLGEVRPELGIPRALDEALKRALEKARESRFATARAFREALEAAAADLPPEPPAVDLPTDFPSSGPTAATSATSVTSATSATSATLAPAPPAPPAPPTPPAPQPTPAPPGDLSRLPGGYTLGRYVIDGRLGGGGMGTVYRARHVLMQRPVALKVLQPEIAADAGMRARFHREARIASRFRHPAVVELYDFDDVGGVLCLAMELVEGRPLDEVLRAEKDRRLETSRVARIFDQLLDALAAAHEGGVVHRDLKPSNLIVGPGDRLKVLDFGIARLLDPGVEGGAPGQGLTRLGEFIGTPVYAAPEQIQGHGVDGRTDIYQTGVILFELLAGRRPFVSQTPKGYLVQHVIDPPPPLSAFRPELSRVQELDAIVARALAKSPHDRFQTAQEMRRALLSVLGPFTPVEALRSPPSAAIPSMASASFSPARSPGPAPAPLASPPPSPPAPGPDSRGALRAVLLIEGAPGLRRVFLVAGRRLAFGRSRDDPRRGTRNDVVLRVLPCRDQARDPDNWAATVRISNAHAEVDVAEDGATATVVDRSARGTLLGGTPLATDRPAPLPDAFELDVAAHALVLAGRVVRAPKAAAALPASIEGPTSLGDEAGAAGGGAGAGGEIDAVVLRRASNCPDQAYALVARSVTLGRAPRAAIDLDAPGVAPLHARIWATADGFEVEALGGTGAPLQAGGFVAPAGARLRLLPGARLRLGEAEVLYREVQEADFVTP